MEQYKYVMFDLDGTIIDSEQGIINAFEYALEYFNIKTAKEILRSFIGPALKDTFMNFYKFDEETANIAVSRYREYYSKKRSRGK